MSGVVRDAGAENFLLAREIRGDHVAEKDWARDSFCYRTCSAIPLGELMAKYEL
jgi:hypothetical protein